MKNLLSILMIILMIVPMGVNAQDEKKDKKPILKTFYDNFFKYATVYGAGDYRAPYESSDKKYLIRTPDGAGIYDVPEVVDVTEYFHQITESDLVFVN